ncbi:hypothetical protein C0992_000312 [Termitomyces sp. T32_za158]|nr:hypothetical protein C0992_000312 [Termitomyces sp. T32_za158]
MTATLHYFAIKFDHVLKANAEKYAEELARNGRRSSWSHRVSTLISKKRVDVAGMEKEEKKKGIIRKLRPDMIRRMDDAPKLVNPSGYAVPLEKAPTLQNVKPGHLSFVPSTIGYEDNHTNTRRNTIIDLEEEDERPARDSDRHRAILMFDYRISDPVARSSPSAESMKPFDVDLSSS